MKIFDGLSRPMRAGGMTLLAAAAIAVLFGCISLLAGSEDLEDAAASTGSETQSSGPGPGGGSKSETASASGEAAEPDEGAEDDESAEDDERAGDDESAGDDTGNGGTEQDQQASDREIPVRIYNNGMTSGLGADAREDFRSRGWNVVEVDNYPYGKIPTSTVYYRPDTDEEFAANALARQFGMRAEPRFAGIVDASPGVIVILTEDYSGPVQSK